MTGVGAAGTAEIPTEKIIAMGRRAGWRTTDALNRAIADLEVALSEAANWADCASQLTERRTGLGCDDDRIIDDPAYDAALFRFGEISKTLGVVRATAQIWERGASDARER